MHALTPEEVDEVTVVGAGTMGHGISQVFATAGYDVTVVDIDEAQLSNALKKIEASLQRLEEDAETVLGRITTTTDRAAGLEGADVMIEAVPEDIELKEQVFAAADDVLPAHAVLATNTSTLPVSEMAAATDRPERVVGMHFSSPVPLMPIVEVISGTGTSEAVFEFAEALSEAVGKTPILVEKDVPGFVLNRVNYAFWSEGLRRLDTGEYDHEAIDAAIRRLGFPMGPFEVLDFAGVDVFYMVCQSMQDRGVPVVITALQEELFEAGKHGMKAGEGFYSYPEPGEYTRIDIPHERRYEYNPYCMIAGAVNAAAWLLENEVTMRADLDRAMRIGMSWPRGPLEMADEYGIDRIVETLERLHEESGWEQYEPHPLLRELVDDGALGVKTGSGFYEYGDERETFGPVRYDRQQFIAFVTLSRPGYRDAINEDVWRGLAAALEHAAQTDAVRATIIRGEGDAFSTGVDIDELNSLAGADEVTVYYQEVVLPAVETLRTHPKPTISLVDGAASGAGCDLVLCSDMAVAGTGSSFSQPAATVGSLPTLWLAHAGTAVGKKKLLEIAMTGEPLTASEAEAVGLVNYTVSSDQALDVARELARSTTASAPHAIESIKDIWSGIEDDTVGDRTEEGVRTLAELLQTEPSRHGLARFLENEPPRWEL